jgi:hypothetical protein
MKKIFISVIFGLILSDQLIVSQFSSLQLYNQKRCNTDKQLMIGLGTWATTNFVASGIGWSQAKSTESTYFHQMNVMWNLVNIGLAIPGYLKANRARTDLTYEETLREQKKTEKIFLINTCVDVAYVSSGWLLLNKSKESGPFEQRQSGYGKSLLLQGGFLFLFDLTAYLSHTTHAKQLMNSSTGYLGVSRTGIGLSWNIPPVTMNRNHRFM